MSDSTTTINFASLRVPIPRELVSWRQEGGIERYGNGKFYARFVPYCDQNVVRERLDAACPSWAWYVDEATSVEIAARRKDAPNERVFTVTGTLRLGDVSRTGIGQGKSPKAAATDAFKRTALLFGVAHELWDMPPVYCEMSGPGREAKPKYDPWTSVDKFHGDPFAFDPGPEPKAGQPYVDAKQPPITTAAPPTYDDDPAPSCPDCDGPMYDNRRDKATGQKKSTYPDFKCKDRNCGKVIWIDRKKPPASQAPVYVAPPPQFDEPPFGDGYPEDDELPF